MSDYLYHSPPVLFPPTLGAPSRSRSPTHTRVGGEGRDYDGTPLSRGTLPTPWTVVRRSWGFDGPLDPFPAEHSDRNDPYLPGSSWDPCLFYWASLGRGGPVTHSRGSRDPRTSETKGPFTRRRWKVFPGGRKYAQNTPTGTTGASRPLVSLSISNRLLNPEPRDACASTRKIRPPLAIRPFDFLCLVPF